MLHGTLPGAGGKGAHARARLRREPRDRPQGNRRGCGGGLRDAQERHCGEAIWFTPENALAEGSISNVFLVRENRLLTPPLDTPVLPGITRALVLQLAESLQIPAEEKACTIDDLLDAEEVFLTNAIMEVMPVTRVEKKAIAEEKVGLITRRLNEAYHDLVDCLD